MPTTPAASPSRPSMKFTALVQTTTVMIVSATRIGAGSTVTPKRGSEKNCTLEGHDPGGDHLAGHLGQPVELADVVDRPDQADDARTPEHTPQLAGDEHLAQERQVARGQHRRGEPQEDGHPAKPRD